MYNDFILKLLQAEMKFGLNIYRNENYYISQLPKQYEEESQEMEVESLGGAPSEYQTSSELESLSNVASGIATSLNLVGNEQTVIYYEQQSDSQDIGGEATVMTGWLF